MCYAVLCDERVVQAFDEVALSDESECGAFERLVRRCYRVGVRKGFACAKYGRVSKRGRGASLLEVGRRSSVAGEFSGIKNLICIEYIISVLLLYMLLLY